MFHLILYEPEIPPNTGNVIRLCANTGSACNSSNRWASISTSASYVVPGSTTANTPASKRTHRSKTVSLRSANPVYLR